MKLEGFNKQAELMSVSPFAVGLKPGKARVSVAVEVEDSDEAVRYPSFKLTVKEAGDVLKELAIPRETGQKVPPAVGTLAIMRVTDSGHVYMDGELVAVLATNTKKARQFARMVEALPDLVDELRLQRKCCREALDGTWVPEGEGLEAFNDMELGIDEALEAAGLKLEVKGAK